MKYRLNRILFMCLSCLLCLSLSSNGFADGAKDEKSSKTNKESLTSKIFNFFKKKNKNEHTEIVFPAIDHYGPNQYRYFLYEYPHQAYSSEPYHQADLNLHTEDYYQTHNYNEHAAVYPQVQPQYSLHDTPKGFQDNVHTHNAVNVVYPQVEPHYSLQETPKGYQDNVHTHNAVNVVYPQVEPQYSLQDTPKGYQDNVHAHNAVDVVYPQVEPQYSLQETPEGFQDDIHNGLHEEIQEVVEEQLYPLGFAYFNYGLDHISLDGLFGKSVKSEDEEDMSSKYHEEVVVDDPQKIHETQEKFDSDVTEQLNNVSPEYVDSDYENGSETSENTNVETKSERFAKAFMHQIQGRVNFEPLIKFDPFEDEKKSRSERRKDNFAFAEHLRRGYGLKVFPKYAR